MQTEPQQRHLTRLWISLLLWVGLVALLIPAPARADLWDEVKSRGVLRWGNDAEGGAPYIYHPDDDASKLIGFEVEFAAAMASRMGVREQFVQNNWDMILPALRQGGSFDVAIAGLERTPENLAKTPMSRPYFVFSQQLIVRAADKNIQTLDDLKGRPVGVLSATASHRLLERRGNVGIRVYQDNVNYFRDLEVGRLDAVLTDSPIAQVNLAGNDQLRPAGPGFESGFYAVAVPDGQTNLLARINVAIAAMTDDGTLQQIYSRYGVWNADQEGLRTWKAPVEIARHQRSALREWKTYLPMLLRAAVTTIWVTCGGMVLAVIWGLALAIVRQYAPAPLRWMAIAYIEVFRGTPLLLQIYFIYFGLAQQMGLKLSAGLAAVLALGLNYAATEAENYRAGLLAVPRGQMEAALALGMKRRVALRRVLLPQALRVSLPSVTNDFIAMFKDSSIVSVIALVELTKEFQIRAIDTGDYLGLGLMTAAIYLGMSWTASLGARRIERLLQHDHR